MGRLTSALRYIARGGPAGDGIPSRVRGEISRHEAVSERLIGWVQLSLVLFFTVLYAVAPRAEGSDGFNFVPIALIAYFLFTVLRLVLSYRYKLPEWFLLISIGADMALLVGLIFSFHIQYNQHPTFYLKTPTLMYVFIFIALRALRFDPRFVLTTGLVAVTGWLGLVFYAALSDMDGMRVTRNYVDYLTGNTILIGAEIDKTMVILAVTVVLTAALYRGREMLFQSIREHAAADDLRRFFAPEVAASITGADTELKAGEGDVREAAILFVDVRGFTGTARSLPPEVVMQVLSRYQSAVGAVIEEHDGRIDKFLGDGILATFGALNPSATPAADALRAALDMPALLDELAAAATEAGWPQRLEIGCALASGPVTVGVVGAEDRLEFTVIGDAVNRAAKLEDANKAEGSMVLTDAPTLERARQQGYDGPGGDLRTGRTLAGLPEAVDLVVLVPAARSI